MQAEACLWKYALRAGQMGGYEFRRQRPVLDYIADFMCFDLKLVIEVDGITHQWDETTEKDRRKEEALMEAGFTVMRFTDEEVLPSPPLPFSPLFCPLGQKVRTFLASGNYSRSFVVYQQGY